MIEYMIIRCRVSLPVASHHVWVQLRWVNQAWAAQAWVYLVNTVDTWIPLAAALRSDSAKQERRDSESDEDRGAVPASKPRLSETIGEKDPKRLVFAETETKLL